MAGNNRKKNNKKNKGSRKMGGNQPPPDLEEVISQADVALETSNVDQALQLYQYASITLRQKLEGETSPVNTSASASTSATDTSDNSKRSTILLLVKVLGKLGEAKASLGDQDGGCAHFHDALSILEANKNSHDEGKNLQDAQFKEAVASMCMYLGQLSTEKEALACFEKAIDNLKECGRILESLGSEEAKSNNETSMNDEGDDMINTSLLQIRRQLGSAHCSVAELYLTDLCFESNAESQCESYLKIALELDDKQSTPDAAQAMANFRLCQNRGLDAMPYIFDAYSRMKVGCEAMAGLVGLGKGQGSFKPDEEQQQDDDAKELKDEALDAANMLPGFEFRCQTAKILLECATFLKESTTEKEIEQRTFCAEAAIQVLGSLLSENDEVVETWYLLGCAFASTTPKNDDASRYYLETALSMLTKIKKGLEDASMMGGNEQKMVQTENDDISSKIEEVNKKLSGLVELESTSMDET